MNNWKIFSNGLFKENPIFVLLLGMCPTLGVTTSAINGLGMGLATTFALLLSNAVISLASHLIPDKIRIPGYIVIIATAVTILDVGMAAYLPSLHAALGIFIPLIVVNCIVLGRAEAFASKNKPLLSLLDGLGMGLGFTLALTLLGSIREILGSGKLFNVALYDENLGILIFVLPPGAFIALGYLIAIINKIKKTL
ncbi:MAG: electron transport complex subunit E [Odoribacteraceae bacterium]|jgi:electron transport complex protein RnfE|nr:electron transport complex subunit E [Odoribacteraceae bacterium]